METNLACPVDKQKQKIQTMLPKSIIGDWGVCLGLPEAFSEIWTAAWFIGILVSDVRWDIDYLLPIQTVFIAHFRVCWKMSLLLLLILFGKINRPAND